VRRRIIFIKSARKVIAEDENMGRPKGAISRIAEELDVDQKTVRRALEAAGMSQEQAEADFNAAVEAAKPFIDHERVVGHQATRATTNPAIRDARSRVEELKAQKLALEIAVTERRLVDREAVTETGVRIISAVRTSLLALGYRLAPKVAGKTDTRDIARIVEQEVRDVLGVLADEDRFLAELEEEALT
jgi:hypothetical protein